MQELLQIAALAAQPLLMPAFVILWFKMNALQQSQQRTLEWLQKYCPHCGAVRIITGE